MTCNKEIVWSVVITHHEDDYKLREERWTTSENPMLFKDKEMAEENLCERLYEVIWKKIYDDEESSMKIIKDAGFESLVKFDENGELKIEEDVMYDLETIGEITEALTKGEYVSKTLTWDITECEINTWLPKHNKPDEIKN